ncbi:MAG: metallophosphoesterase [Clostridia bacterium]|nr:metallophosphoesterase [Clostridia bacterium]
MRILVFSDSHGNVSALRRALAAQPQASHVFFLGDCLRDIEALEDEFRDKIFHKVSGNCDFGALNPSTAMENLNGTLIFYSHGHPYYVKQSTVPFLQAAEKRGAKIALFGHTHSSLIKYENGVYLVNPGSVSMPREGRPSYAVIDIEENGIMPIIVNSSPVTL